MLHGVMMSHQDSCIGTLVGCGATAKIDWLLLSFTLLQCIQPIT